MDKWVRYLARGIALVWALWWTLFGLLAGISEGYDWLGIFRHAAVPGLVFLLAAVIAWRWEIIGGTLLILEGIATLVVFPFTRTLEGFLTLFLPPLIAGTLFVASRIRGGTRR
jgi:uncharacterized integral membrane protein